MTIEEFAQKYGLHLNRQPGDGSDMGDLAVYAGTRNHPDFRRQLYFDDGELCLMVIDGPLLVPRKWQSLGGKLWLGDISREASGRGIQDVKITGIPLANAKAAIRLVRATRVRVLSESHRAKLVAAGAATRLKPKPKSPHGN